MVAGPEENIAMKAHLTVLSGRHRGETIPITHSPFLIGRDPAAHLRPTNSTIGKQLCAILVDERRALVQDFAHRTRVNERPIEGAAELTDGDCLQVGPLVFRFSIEGTQPLREGMAATTSSSDDHLLFGKRLHSERDEGIIGHGQFRSSDGALADAHPRGRRRHQPGGGGKSRSR
jgi:hypothetical protein